MFMFHHMQLILKSKCLSVYLLTLFIYLCICLFPSHNINFRNKKKNWFTSTKANCIACKNKSNRQPTFFSYSYKLTNYKYKQGWPNSLKYFLKYVYYLIFIMKIVKRKKYMIYYGVTWLWKRSTFFLMFEISF